MEEIHLTYHNGLAALGNKVGQHSISTRYEGCISQHKNTSSGILIGLVGCPPSPLSCVYYSYRCDLGMWPDRISENCDDSSI